MIDKHEVPNMILIGSTGRNSGKTTLAISIIDRYKTAKTVIALKVTTIEVKNGRCPRGGEGCGVCSSLDGDFQIIEEFNSYSNKDTSLLLKAGAHKVYWLKTLKSNIYEGFEAIINKIPEDAIIVCESNSLRTVVNPGVFVMLKNTSDYQIKKSASTVIDKADLVIEDSINNTFNLGIKYIEERIKY